MPIALQELPDRAFYGCTGLSEIQGDGLQYVGHQTLYGCTALTKLTLSPSVLLMEADALEQCENLAILTVQNPSMRFADDAAAVPEQAVLCGYAGSTAQQYAEKYQREFLDLNTQTSATSTTSSQTTVQTQTTVQSASNIDTTATSATTNSAQTSGTTASVTGTITLPPYITTNTTSGTSAVSTTQSSAFDTATTISDQISTTQATATTPVVTTTTTSAPIVQIPGDADGDGEVTMRDSEQILLFYSRMYAGDIRDVSDVELSRMDVNRDGVITILDAYSVLRYYALKMAGYPVSPPEEWDWTQSE